MKKRALEGAYLLAHFEEYKSESFDEVVSMITHVTHTNKRNFMAAYQAYKNFLCNGEDWQELKKSYISVVIDFKKKNEKDTKEFNKKYFNEIREAYDNQIKRTENYLLGGEKYARIYNIEYGLEDKIKLDMSIVTKNTMAYDRIMFDENIANTHSQPYYRPYFIEFSSDYIDKEYLKNIISFEDDDNMTRNEQWIEIRFVDEQSNARTGTVIKGEYLFSASPLEIGKRQIEIVGVNVPNEVKNFSKLYIEKAQVYLYDSKAQKSKDKRLDNIFVKECNEIVVTIFNVGQGSLNLIEIDDQKFLFDIGQSKGNGGKLEQILRKRAQEIIKDIKPNHIILSHWDLDHILGITNMTDKIFAVNWIVPDIKSGKGFSDAAKRLICFLAWYKKTNLIVISSKKNDFNNTIVYSNNVFELGKGRGKWCGAKKNKHFCGEINSLTYNNNFELVLKIKGKEEEIIFAGDCEYEALPKNFMKDYPEYLVVPHHGSKMIYNTSINSSKAKTAFISAGKNNYDCKHNKGDCSSHPHICHIGFLEGLGYSIYKTSITGSYTFSVL